MSPGAEVQAVDRVKKAHHHLLILGSSAASGDVDDVEENLDEVRSALDDVESLIVEDGGEA